MCSGESVVSFHRVEAVFFLSLLCALGQLPYELPGDSPVPDSHPAIKVMQTHCIRLFVVFVVGIQFKFTWKVL